MYINASEVIFNLKLDTPEVYKLTLNTVLCDKCSWRWSSPKKRCSRLIFAPPPPTSVCFLLLIKDIQASWCILAKNPTWMEFISHSTCGLAEFRSRKYGYCRDSTYLISMSASTHRTCVWQVMARLKGIRLLLKSKSKVNLQLIWFGLCTCTGACHNNEPSCEKQQSQVTVCGGKRLWCVVIFPCPPRKKDMFWQKC